MRLNLDLGPESVVGGYTSFAISPDGTRVVFLARGADGRPQLATRLLGQSKATLLSGTDDAAQPFFSSDGQSIGFFAGGKLKTISVQGGAPVVLANAPAPRGGAWMNDGSIIAALSLTGVYRIPAGGGTVQPLIQATDPGAFSQRWPQALPGGKAIMYTSGAPGGFADANLDVLTLSTGQRKTVLRGGYFGRYLPGGYLVYIHQGTLSGVGFDLDRLQVRGTPVPVLDDVASDPTSAAAQFDFSQTGAFVYLTGSGTIQNRRLAWLDSAGDVQPLPAAPGPYLTPRLSPDGSRVALMGSAAAPQDLWVYDWQRDRMTRLTFSGHNSRFPAWSPDGKHIAFAAATGEVGWVRADGAGGEQRLLQTAGMSLPFSFSPDGRRLAFYQFSSKTGFDIWTVSLDLSDPDHPKAGKPELFLGTEASERNPSLSPDGRWMAYESDESVNYEIYVRPFPSGSAKWQVSTGGGTYAFWSRDGRQLFYETPDNRIMVADCVAKGDSLDVGTPRLWSPRRIAPVNPYVNFSLHPDGKRFLVFPTVEGSGESASGAHATFLLNFTDELKRRIP
jgi:serine/threonine-protein kinase